MMDMFHENHEDRYHIDASVPPRDRGNRVLKCGDTFAVFDSQGDIIASGAWQHGLYHEGTRFLSHSLLTLGRMQLLPLGFSLRYENLVLGVDLTNPDLYIDGDLLVPHGTLHVARTKFLSPGTLHERIRITNYGQSPCEVDLVLHFGADFVDLFEVRGTRRNRRGRVKSPSVREDSVLLSYTGLDHEVRSALVEFSPAPLKCSASEAAFRIQLDAKEERILYVTVRCSVGKEPAPNSTFEAAYSRCYAEAQALEEQEISLFSSNEQFNDWVHRSLADLRMMLAMTEDGPYPHAGVPWFSAPFGRDGLITALETLWVNPGVARGVLGFLARNQATAIDEARDAEPGKILHELRLGEMAALGEIPFGRYYGSIDSTPLFIILAGEYYRATSDQKTIERLWPSLERAIDWIDRFGDRDGDGFVEYDRRTPEGLAQQGWKDSHDSVFHADGSAAEPPIALCEVQGYVHSARRHAATLAEAMGEPVMARELNARADELQEKFDRAFWCEELSMFALALDGAKKQCRVRTSNAGQCLFTGIVLPERAGPLAEQLLSDEMFSGWGIRTLGRSERRYNPMAYHNGSIWPHDNALIADGLARYGFVREATQVLGALFDTSLFVELRRLPELFCGFARRPGEGPVLYPVACSPQAWAAGVPFLMLKAVLGLKVDAAQKQLVFSHPSMPSFLETLLIKKLRVGGDCLDLRLERHERGVGVNVLGRTGTSEVVVIK